MPVEHLKSLHGSSLSGHVGCRVGSWEWIWFLSSLTNMSQLIYFYFCVLILWSNRRSAIHRGRVWFSQVSVYFAIKMSAPPHKRLSWDFQIPPRQMSVNFVLLIKWRPPMLNIRFNVCSLVKITLSSPVCRVKSTRRLRFGTCLDIPTSLSQSNN